MVKFNVLDAWDTVYSLIEKVRFPPLVIILSLLWHIISIILTILVSVLLFLSVGMLGDIIAYDTQ